ncbi:MAG: nitroreductase family protein [Solirubrobacterales bacterium]|nr:nitroreductase family protein [Solirubrobacterales bacterium]
MRLIEQAVKAPSSHNTQPWIFEPSEGEILLRPDRNRALPVNDADDRELTISCGAALFNLRAAAAAAGTGTSVELLATGTSSDPLARVRIEPGPGGEDGSLAGFIGKRRTVRKPFQERAVEQALVSGLGGAVEAEGAWLCEVEDDRRADIAGLVAEGDRIQFSDPEWRRELSGWMRSSRKGDGMSLFGLVTPFVRPVVRAFDLGKSTAEKDRKLAGEAPLLVVLGTDGDSPEDWLRAGQAVQRALLVAAGEGVQAGYLNQPCQVPELRPRLGRLLSRPGHPQLVLRLGYPDEELRPVVRRPVQDMLRI